MTTPLRAKGTVADMFQSWWWWWCSASSAFLYQFGAQASCICFESTPRDQFRHIPKAGRPPHRFGRSDHPHITNTPKWFFAPWKPQNATKTDPKRHHRGKYAKKNKSKNESDFGTKNDVKMGPKMSPGTPQGATKNETKNEAKNH